MANIVPFGASAPTNPENPLQSGIYQGVHLTCLAENVDQLRETIERWYQYRDDVILVDSGITEKAEQGYIIIEWEECQADQLFLDILSSEEAFIDFSVYIRDSEA